jgi:hypothetical protein
MHSGLIQKLKRELYNTRVSLDDLSSFKSIPKILSDFKDMFIFSKQGQRALDVEVQNLGDPSIKVADLEDARREIIALSGIPAPYLGYMDVVELREQLVHSNVTFATEISDMQENDNDALSRMVDIIAEIKELGYKPSKYVKVSLIPPVVLIVQLIEMTLSSIGNIAGVFTNLQYLSIHISSWRNTSHILTGISLKNLHKEIASNLKRGQIWVLVEVKLAEEERSNVARVIRYHVGTIWTT